MRLAAPVKPLALMALSFLGVVLAPALLVTAAGTTSPASEWAPVVGRLPIDLEQPEGRTRWDFRGLTLGERFERSLASSPGEPAAVERSERGLARDAATATRLRFSDPAGGDAAERWLRPDLDTGLFDAESSRRIELDVEDDAGDRRLMMELRRVGLGWADLPSGPREVVLQRALVYETLLGGRGYRQSRLVYRWVDPRAGLVAVVDGPVDARGRHLGQADALVATRVEKSVGLRIYVDQIDVPPLTHIAYGYDRGNVSVASLTPEGHTTIGDLAAAGAWDFSGTTQVNAEAEVASTKTSVTQDETCNFDKCGFNLPGAILNREDKNFDDLANLNVTLSAQEREDRAGDATIWLRAGVTNEGETGAAVGDGENRICFVGDERTEVPLFRFAHQDANGFYLQNGDTWAHAPFACELDIFALSVCPDGCGLFCPNYTFACDDHPGVNSNAVIGEGPITLPSGHTFNALLVKNVADFCAGPGDACGGLFAQDVRTVVYLWIVPHLGTVARLMSGVSEIDDSSFTTLAETDIKFGLFPPRSVSVTAQTETTLDIAWDPGLDTHRIDGYRIYWDNDSGEASDYAFDSFNNPGQVTVAGTTASISGLDPGTEYFVTVTAVSDFVNPRTGVQTTYESLLFPTTVSAQPTPLPAEVSASTTGGTCTPTVEVGGVTVSSVEGGCQICWDVADDPCLDGYQILVAESPNSAQNYSVLVPDTGLSTCRTVDTTATYFLVVASGSGGTGPWGHYGR